MSFASNPSEFLGRLQKSKVFGTDGSGYSHIQSTFPQTLGYGLTDSPVALLGWIYEKLVSWTDNYPWTSDEILTWISIYWFSRAGPTASLRIYYEAFMTNALPENKDTMFCFRSYIPGPRIGLSHFPAEILPMPVKWGRFYGPVVLEKEHDRGGHFAAYEVPEKLVEDVREMFKKDGPCHGLIKGAGGY